MAAAIVLLAFSDSSFKQSIIITLMALGLLSDIFDGIIARRLGVSTETMRRLDSTIDQVFWIAVVASAVILSPGFFRANLVLVGLLVVTETLTYLISYLRFGKEVATHAISSKMWTLILFATLIELIATGTSSWLFLVCIVGGIVTRLEIIAILLLLRKWTNDVPSVYHAIRLRRGKAIRRNKMFNG
jgi:CDP-diacylglycerol--glycerol-3-phosphate 3-phosphatidyltransferase